MNLTQWITENGTKIVSVTYPDNKGNHETTLRDLGDRWQSETKEWKNNFFNDLMTKGQAYSKFGKYDLK